jgi:RNA polymerase sigma-70 factor (ECF subfamily)
LSLDERFGEEQEYCVSERLANCGLSPEDECIKSELHERLMQFVAELSPSLRKAYELRDLDGLTTREAARILGVADVTVKAQVSRARAKLRRLMRVALDAQPHSALTCTASPAGARK